MPAGNLAHDRRTEKMTGITLARRRNSAFLSRDSVVGEHYRLGEELGSPGGAYSPFIIERSITVTGNTLKLYYTTSAWNPYVVYKMRSEFTIGTAPP